jgi:RNA-binding protein YhbY
MNFVAIFQIGKSGITQGVIDSLASALKNHKQVRISALKSSGRDRDKIKEMGEEICNKLSKKYGGSYFFKVIGFTIILKKRPTLRKR